MIFNLGNTEGLKKLEEHMSDSTAHVTESEKTAWTDKAEKEHKHTKSEITDFPSTMPPSEHNQSASTVTEGTFGGTVKANATAVADLTTAQIRNVAAGTSAVEDVIDNLSVGDIYFRIEGA